MFYDCGNLKGQSSRLKELQKIRQLKRRKLKYNEISKKYADQYYWRKENSRTTGEQNSYPLNYYGIPLLDILSIKL